MAIQICLMNDGVVTADGVAINRGDLWPESFETIKDIPAVLGSFMIVGKESAGEIDPRFLTDEKIADIMGKGPLPGAKAEPVAEPAKKAAKAESKETD